MGVMFVVHGSVWLLSVQPSFTSIMWDPIETQRQMEAGTQLSLWTAEPKFRPVDPVSPKFLKNIYRLKTRGWQAIAAVFRASYESHDES